MAEGGTQTGVSPQCRRPQRADAGRSVVTGRSQHGPRLADSAESKAPLPAVRDTSTDLGGIRSFGDRDRSPEGVSSAIQPLAPLGDRTGDTDPAVHPQERASGVGTPISTGSVLQMLEGQRYRCALSGRGLTPQTAALDHIVPVRCGGEHVGENAQILHKEVNRAKGSLTNAEFLDLCREVVDWSRRAAGGSEEARS